jgi:hypothetical protein
MIHRSRPGTDGNPRGTAICGAALGESPKWRKDCIPNCGACNAKAGKPWVPERDNK